MLLKQSLSKTSWFNKHPLFRHRQVTKSVWHLEEKYFDSWNLANLFLVQGSKCDLLVDTGIGLHDLPNYLLWSKLREDRDKPLKVALTHSHFDHSGGAHQFQNLPGVEGIYVHAEEIEVLRKASKYLSASWIEPNEVWPKPDGWKARDYNIKPVSGGLLYALNENDKFDLGDKTIEVMHVPGHSRGSLALYCPEEGVLATGDTAYRTDHELIDWYPQSSSRDMSASVQRILNMSNKVEFALPGHNEVLTKDELANACERHLQSAGKFRTIRKSFSRTRASLILALNSRIAMPSQAREWIKQ